MTVYGQQDSPLFYPRKRVLSTFACYKTSHHASLSILPHLFLLYVCPKLNILSFNTHTHTHPDTNPLQALENTKKLSSTSLVILKPSST
mmetsp:Transcript_27896/g.40796  ORF Transcript_27896/g.40796 Transcript_27896/m.40796 type:complete len:89 (+) Transcript_27896:111-377(+)